MDFIVQLGDFCYRDENRKVVCQPDKMPPNIKYIAPYEAANFAILTITDEEIDIKGTPNKYHGPTPAERGFCDEKSW